MSHAAHDEHDEHETAGPKVLSVSDKNPKVSTIQVARPEPVEASFLAAAAKGIGITFKHFARNVFLPRRKAVDLGKGGAPPDAPWRNDIETVQYPEEKVQYPERFRGPPPADAARGRRGALRRVHVLPDGVPGALHHDHPRGERQPADREAPRGVRDRRAALRGVRAVRRGVPVRRHPDGHRRARKAGVSARRRDRGSRVDDLARASDRSRCRAAKVPTGATASSDHPE